MSFLEGEWDTFKEVVLEQVERKELTTQEESLLKTAFYIGALAFYTGVVVLSPEDMTEMTEEVNSYFRKLRDARKKTEVQ